MSKDFYCMKCFKLVAIIEKGSRLDPGLEMICLKCNPKNEKPKGPPNDIFGGDNFMEYFKDILGGKK